MLSDGQQKVLKGRGGAASGRGTSNREHRQVAIRAIQANAIAEVGPISPNELRLAGLMLYWAEGSKTKFVDFANSDPSLVRFMIVWFRNTCLVNKEQFRAQIHLHNGQNEIRAKTYWSQLTNIPLHRFHKTYMKKEGTGHRKRRLDYGTIKIRICDKNLLYRILGWIEGFKQQWVVSSVGRAADLDKGPARRKGGMQTG